MKVMYSMFKKSPNKKSLETIINNCKQTLYNTALDFRGLSQFTPTMAKSYSVYWVNMVDDNPSIMSNKNRIDQNFLEILDDIHLISKSLISIEVRDIYINIVDEYSKKITNVYQL